MIRIEHLLIRYAPTVHTCAMRRNRNALQNAHKICSTRSHSTCPFSEGTCFPALYSLEQLTNIAC